MFRVLFLNYFRLCFRGWISKLPRFAVFGHDEAVCLAIVEGVSCIVVGEHLVRSGCDVADVGILGTEAAVCDGASSLHVAPLHAFDEVVGVVQVVVV